MSVPFSALFDLLPIGAYRGDGRGRFLRVNAALCDLTGHAGEAEFLATSPESLNYVDPHRGEQLWADLMRHGVLEDAVSELWRHNGRGRIYVRERARLLPGPEGAIVGVEGTVEDVTAELRTQAALEFSERRFQALTEGAQVLTLVCDVEGRMGYVSAASQMILGHPAHSRSGTSVFEWMHPDDEPGARAEFSRVIDQADSGIESMVRFRHADGSWRHLATLTRNFLRDVAVGGIVLNCRDVTERRRAEERLQCALDASGICIWDFDVEAGLIYLSESWSQRLGGPARPTSTTFPELGEHLPPADRERVLGAIVNGLKDPSASFRVEHRLQRFDGVWLWNVIEGRVVERGEDGRAVRMVGTNRDITAMKQADAARRDLETQLRESQKMEAVGTLAAGIAHDFNNILGAILGNVVLARQDIGAAHAASPSLEQIDKSARRARTLVHQILAFGRRHPQELVVRQLKPLIDETVGLLRSLLPAGVSLETCLDDEPMNIRADATQIQQVLMNLCTNAWHALKERAGHVVVGYAPSIGHPGAMTPRPTERFAHIWVKDTGCGMDEATQARIFEPFFTTKAVGEGTGLGLSVVHGIITAHNGFITVESVPGEGSTFHLYLPAVDSQVEAVASAWDSLQAVPKSWPAEHAAALQRQPHILYVDDDDVMALVAERLLERRGLRVTVEHDPQIAIAMVRAQPAGFDLVVTDYNMPGCSGMDVARAIRHVRPDLQVVVCSGYITDDMRTQLLGVGVRHLLPKENAVEDLGPLIERLLLLQ